jgi:cytochrome P450
MHWIKNASYTKLVIEESMRLFPPAYFIDRVNIEEDTWNCFTQRLEFVVFNL